MSNRTNLLLTTLVLLAIGLACGSKTPPPTQYVGTWTGSDGTEITIRGDGSGDYKSGNSSVSGGTVTIDESAKALKITMLSMGPTFTIDKAPAGDQMTLSGVVFHKGGGTTSKTDSPSKKTTTSSGDDIPAKDELQDLARQTVLDFNDAIQSDDFTDFHSTLAEPFKREVSAERLAGVFHEFVTAKLDFSSLSGLDATFTTPPAMVEQAGHDMLRLKGYYPTKPRRTNFELKYIFEEGTWKLSHIDINTK